MAGSIQLSTPFLVLGCFLFLAGTDGLNSLIKISIGLIQTLVIHRVFFPPSLPLSFLFFFSLGILMLCFCNLFILGPNVRCKHFKLLFPDTGCIMSSLPPIPVLKCGLLVPLNVAVFGDRVFERQLGLYEVIGVGLNRIICVLISRNQGTDRSGGKTTRGPVRRQNIYKPRQEPSGNRPC